MTAAFIDAPKPSLRPGFQAMAFGILGALGLIVSAPAHAALPVGAKAPDFKVKAATNGVVSDVDLQKLLKKGPVVVYFYPKAFTSGCSLEARQFAEAMPRFEAQKASVIGLSRDSIEVLKDFSTKDCQGKFPVGADPDGAITKAYDAGILGNTTMSSRISYVIAKDGTVSFVHDDLSAAKHVDLSLQAVEALNKRR